MKILAAVLVSMALVGCGIVERGVASATGYSAICVNGVKYPQFTSGASVAYNKDGKIENCN